MDDGFEPTPCWICWQPTLVVRYSTRILTKYCCTLLNILISSSSAARIELPTHSSSNKNPTITASKLNLVPSLKSIRCKSSSTRSMWSFSNRNPSFRFVIQKMVLSLQPAHEPLQAFVDGSNSVAVEIQTLHLPPHFRNGLQLVGFTQLTVTRTFSSSLTFRLSNPAWFRSLFWL